MRTFIAIDLDPAVKKAISDFQRKLRRLGPPTVAWTRESGWHLTLKFLGEIDEFQANRLGPRLQEIAAATPSFGMSVRGAGTFPPGRPPRVLWVGAAAPPVLAELQSRVEAAAEKEGIPREDRPFHPHLTLGRIRAPGGLQPVLAEIERARDLDFGDMTARAFIFFQSVLKPTGAEYTTLRVFELS